MDLKFYQFIEASPKDIFLALTSPFSIQLWSGQKAIMDDKEGTEFELWDGDITGKNLKIIPNKELIQEWYFGDIDKPSIATIKIHEEKKGTSVEVRHTNIPEEAFDNIKEGWQEYYIGAIKRFFESDLY